MAKIRIKGFSIVGTFLALLLLFYSLTFGLLSPSEPSSLPVFASGTQTGISMPTGSFSSASKLPSASASANARRQYKNLKLYVGGMPFGVKFLTEGVLVVGFEDVKTSTGSMTNPARAAGLAPQDRLIAVNGQTLNGASDLCRLVEASGGKPLQLRYLREGAPHETTLTPVRSSAEGRYVSGLYVRDSGAGIGTVTFIVPETGAFAGLGHGICDSESGQLIPIERGAVVDVTISGVVKGLAGTPGEVKGYFRSGKTGTLLGNSECGVWGVFANLPDACATAQPVPVGLRNELKAGKATLRCTLSDNVCRDYEIEISDIRKDSQTNKCFTVRITDPDLLSKTGGIIQGMSGSPIIQNGKLVGAVTHVLINDPTTGYGIFIENMLNTAQMPMARAS